MADDTRTTADEAVLALAVRFYAADQGWTYAKAGTHVIPWDHASDETKERFVVMAQNATPPAPAQPGASHPDDEAIDAFAAAMKAKMRFSREVKGRGAWQTCPPDRLSDMLRGHVEKADPVDVANFCMMLHALDARIAAQPGASDGAVREALERVLHFIEQRRAEDLICFTLPLPDGSRDLSVMDDAERENIAESDEAISALRSVIAALSSDDAKGEG